MVSCNEHCCSIVICLLRDHFTCQYHHLCHWALVSNSKWSLLILNPLLDLVLAIFLQLPGELDTKLVLEHLTYLLQRQTRHLSVEEDD